MPLIVGGSALPTDKPIIGASGEIHKVVAKNGDVIWEMVTDLPEGVLAILDATHYWEISAGSLAPIKIVYDQNIPISGPLNKYSYLVGEVSYVRGKATQGSRSSVIKVINGFTYYQAGSGVENLSWVEYNTPVNDIKINAVGNPMHLIDPAEILSAHTKGTYDKAGYRYHRGSLVKTVSGASVYRIGRTKI